MCFTEKIVNLQRIDTHNDSFRITTDQQVDALMCSIKHLGLLNFPLLLEKETGYYTVVSGFRRIEACRRLNWSELKTRVLGSDTERLKCVKYAITDNAFQRPLNIIEKSLCIMMLSAFHEDFDSLAEALKTMGLSEHPAMLKKIKIVYDMSESLQNSLLSNTIPLAMALELTGLPMHDADGFINLFNALKLSLNKQKEILMMVKEIAIREDMSVTQVLEAPYLKDILINKDLDKNQKARRIREYLKRRRYPAITSAEQSFQKHLQKLNTRKEMELIPPVNFEGSSYTLKLTFKTITDLKEIKSNLDAFVENPFLKKIISD
jgi:ParB family chromosome partitioning protein